MKIFEVIAALVFAIGILLIAGMGVDLTYARAGGGMMICAVGCLLVALVVFRRGAAGINGVFVTAIILGGAYFIWRALAGGPIGLAVGDVTIVLILLAAFLVGAGGQLASARVFTVAIGIACLANVVVVALQLSGQSPWFVWREPFGSKAIGTGFFGHYNYLAAFLNGSLFLFLTLAFAAKSWPCRILSGVIALSAIACLFASGSRGGWVSFVVGFGVWVILGLIFLKSRKHPGFGGAAIVSFLILVGLVVTSVSVVQELTNRRAGALDQEVKENVEIGDGGRVYFQQMAFEIFQESPVIGSGPRAFSYLALEHWDLDEYPVHRANPKFAHNEFLQVLADYGLVGFIIVMVCVCAFVVMGVITVIFESRGDSGLGTPLKIGALCGLAAMLAQCFFSFLFHVPACAMIAGILMGMIVQKSAKNQGSGNRVRALWVVGSLLLVASGLGFLGWRFMQSYRLDEEAKSSLETRVPQSEVFDLLEVFKEAAETGYNHDILESSGRLALRYSTGAFDDGNVELAEKYAKVAMAHFQGALKLNPYSSVAIVMIPHVHEALGEFEAAEVGYAKAMERLWVRESSLKPYLYAARSQYRQGLIAQEQRKNAVAARHFREAVARLNRRTEILDYWREIPEDKEFRLEIEARIAYLEGELLFQEGDRVWKKVRPRKPELAYALMLAAAENYQASEKVMEPITPRWKAQWKQLQENLNLFETVRTKPALVTEKEISTIINPEEDLEPDPSTR